MRSIRAQLTTSTTASAALLAVLAMAAATGCGSENESLWAQPPEAGPSGAGGTGGAAGADAQPDGSQTPADGPVDAGVNPALGAACESDANCAGGLTCVLATGTSWLQGGPAHGYCTTKCTSDGAECAPHGGVCVLNVGVGANGWCLEKCQLGGTDRANKCHDRKDVGCSYWVWESSEQPVCYPICPRDADCPAGRVCDPVNTVCVGASDAASTLDPIGSFCPNLGTSNCAGWCWGASYVNAPLACTRDCILGEDGCGAAAGSVDAGAGNFCMPLMPNTTPGDVGHCVQACEVTSECLAQSDLSIFCNDSTRVTSGHGYCDGTQVARRDAQTDAPIDAPADAEPPDAGPPIDAPADAEPPDAGPPIDAPADAGPYDADAAAGD